MKIFLKIINIIGYLSLFLLPYGVAIIILSLDVILKIIFILVFFIIILLNIKIKKNFKETLGLRILICIISLIFIMSIVNYIYIYTRGNLFKNSIEYINTNSIVLEKKDLDLYKIRYVPGDLTLDYLDKGGSNIGKIKFKDSNQIKQIYYAFPIEYYLNTELNPYSFLIIRYGESKYYLTKK